MTDDAALLVPPAVDVFVTGDGMAGVAASLAERLPQARIHNRGAQTGDAARTAPGAAGLLLVPADCSVEAALAPLAAGGAAAAGGHRRRVWLAVDAALPAPTLQQLDGALDEVDTVTVAGVVLVAPGEPTAVARAVAAWLWLRHDAPSNAFAELRDTSDGACRYAAIAASAPVAPPQPNRAPAQPSPGAGEHAVMLLTRALDSAAERARAAASQDVPPSPEAVTLSASADTDAVTDVAAAIKPDDVTGLMSAAAAARSTADQPDDSATLTAAGLALVQAQTAWRVEDQRTGLTARIGRRKRLAAAAVQRDAAEQEWRQAYANAWASQVRRETAAALATELDQRAVAAQSSAEERVDAAHRTAVAAWLTDATAAAARLAPPATVDARTLTRAWGTAVPAVQRYLLSPIDVSADDDADTGVHRRFAPGVGEPIASAVILGIPLRALVVDSAVVGAADQARDSNMPKAAAKPSTERGS